MFIKPIPIKLLKNTVIYRAFIGEERGGNIWGEEEKITNVALSYSSKYSVSGESQYMRYKAILFYCNRNSRPKNIHFKEQDLIIHDGRQMVIERVIIPNQTRDKPHHIEIELFDSGRGN